MRSRYFHLGPVLLPVLAACTSHSPSPAPAGASLARAESLYADLRRIRDRVDVNTEAGRMPGADAIRHHNALRNQLARSLAAVDSTALRDDDARALGIMRRTLVRDLGAVAAPITSGAAVETRPACDYDANAVVAAPKGLDSLRKRLYACYGWAQSHLTVEGETLDRLSILGALGRAESPDVRRKLFLSLEPVWYSVNRDNGTGSPYRLLIAREVKDRGNAQPPATEQARASGVPPDSLEPWLLRMLETWREVTPDSLIEPWDWFYRTGLTSRRLSPLISLERLTSLNRQVYRSLGADPGALGVQYNLEPHEGKTPVAYCTFGRRPSVTGPTATRSPRQSPISWRWRSTSRPGSSTGWGTRCRCPTGSGAAMAGSSSTSPGPSSRCGCSEIPGPTPTRCGPRSPATTCAFVLTPSFPGGQCAVSWWTHRAT